METRTETLPENTGAETLVETVLEEAPEWLMEMEELKLKLTAAETLAAIQAATLLEQSVTISTMTAELEALNVDAAARLELETSQNLERETVVEPLHSNQEPQEPEIPVEKPPERKAPHAQAKEGEVESREETALPARKKPPLIR